MKNSKEFDNILNECLERLLTKGVTIEQCLQSYPEHNAELETLLRTAMVTRKAMAVQPQPELKAKARYQFNSVLQEVKPKGGLPLLSWHPRWAATIAIVLGLLLVGSGTVTAAGYSMPDSPLYPVKLATEQARLTLTSSDINKANLYAELADRRVSEIAYIVNKGNLKQIESTTQRLNNDLTMMAGLLLAGNEDKSGMLMAPAPAPPPQAERGGIIVGSPEPDDARGRLRVLLEHSAINNVAILRAALEQAPEAAKPALRQAIDTSVATYEEALDALD